MKPLRTAIFGCGRFAKRHAAILAGLPDIQLVGFCDRNVERAQAYNQQFARGEAAVYTNHRELLEQMDLDLLYICLQPYAHTDEVELACQRGVHFLIEKPIALDLDTAQAMVAQVRAAGVKSQVGFMYRFGEAVAWLKKNAGAELAAGQAFLAARYACNSLHSGWWRDRSKSGGQLVEQVIHLLDLARYFLGEPSLVYSLQDNLFHREVEGYTSEDASATSVRFQSGALAAITATNGAIPNRWDYDWRVFLPGLTADFVGANHAVFHNTRLSWPSSATIASEKDLFLAETLDLIEAIRDDRPTAVPIEEGLRSLNFALAAARSAETGQPVTVEQPLD